MATDFQIYKNVNNQCNCEYASVSVFSSKQWERGDRKALKFPIKALIDVALFQLVKATSGRGIMLTASGSHIGRIMTFYLKSFIKFLVLSYRNYLFPVPIMILQIHDLIRLKHLSNTEPHIIVRIFCNYGL